MAIEKRSRYKLHLDDAGQDFLWFVVQGNMIVDCGPFQASVWTGKKIIPPKRWRGGQRIVFADGRTLNYRIRRAERLV